MKADEEPFAENYLEEQGDEDSITTDVGRPQRKRKRAVNNEFLFYQDLSYSFFGI